MDSNPPSRTEADTLADACDKRLRDLRGRFVAQRKDREDALHSLEERLSAELQSIADQVAAELAAEQAHESSTLEALTAERLAELDQRASELDRAYEDIESERTALAAERETLEQQSLSELEAVEARLRELADREAQHRETANQFEKQAATLAEREADQAAEVAHLESSYAELEHLEAEIAARLAELDARSNELADRADQLDAREAGASRSGDARVARLTSELASARAEIESLTLRIADDDDNSAAIAVLEAERDATRDEIARVRSEAAEQKAEADATIEQLNAALTSAAERLEAAPEAEEFGTLHKKFELAQQDVATLRARVSELESGEGASESSHALSAELETLRAERDAALRHAEDLEGRAHAAAAEASADDDLRRRFEMAVDDIRQLKSEKALLEAKLNNDAAPVSGNDWESQKRRMLASLEGDDAPERREERATIEGTVRITDGIVASKDREIAELRKALAESEASRDDNTAQGRADQQVSVFDDAAVAAELARVEELRGQWEAKLREAELELSVERARIAREQAELAEWRIELEGMADAMGAVQKNKGGKPQSNWMRKMGLNGGDGK